MNIKKYISITFCVVCGLILFAQQKMYIHNLGNIIEKNIFNGDNIKFNGNNSVFNNSGETQYIETTNIDSITFGNTITDSTIYIIYNESYVTVTNPFANAGLTITENGTNVTVNAATGIKDLKYHVSGSTSDGFLQITSDYRLTVILEGADITSSTQPAIWFTEDKAATIILADGTTNSLTDNAANSSKATLMSKTQIVFSEEGNGTLNVTGNSKHAIFSNDYVRFDGGVVNIKGAQSDGIHADYFIMNNGELNISNTLGDGIDGDAGYVEINDGKISITSSADDIKGIKCDSIITVNGGTIDITLTGAAAKGMKNGLQDITINNGTITMNLSGGVYSDGTGDYSYTAGIKSDANINVYGGTINITNQGTGGKAFNADGNLLINDGKLTLILSGAMYLEPSGTGYDPSYSSGIKVDGNIEINGGNTNITCESSTGSSRGISSDNNITINGGIVSVTTKGAGSTYTNSNNTTDTTAAACIKSDGSIFLYAGNITCTSSGTGGKGINANGTNSTIAIGAVNANNSNLILSVTTSGSTGSSSSGSTGGWNPGGQQTTTSSMFSPKTINSEGLLTVNSGTITLNSTDDGLHSNSKIIIENGTITIDADDDGIHADSVLTINGGTVKVINSYEGFEAYEININGGTTSVVASDDGWNAAGGTTTSSSSTGGWPGMGGGMSTSTGIMYIRGGYHFVTANGDGVDSNGDIYMYGGTVLVLQEGGGNGILDIGDNNNKFYYEGGTLFGVGTADMWESLTTSKTYLTNKSMTVNANTLITVSNGNNVIAAFKPTKQIYAGIFASDSYTSSYKFYTGGTYSGTLDENGYAEGGTVSGATAK